MDVSFPKKKKSIVEPTQWESANVGVIEGESLSSGPVARRSKVSSMRSSLFQKSAKTQVPTLTVIGDGDQIFESAEDAAVLNMPLLFLSTPGFDFCEYGAANKGVWAKDIISIMHNSLRSEIKDLVKILEAIKIIGANLATGDLFLFQNWWYTCCELMLNYLDCETKFLIPWVQEALASNPSKVCSKLVTKIPMFQKKLRELLAQISKLFEQMEEGSPKAVAVEIKSRDHLCVDLVVTFDRLISKLVKHMYEQETHFPPVLSVAENEDTGRERILGELIIETTKSSHCPEMMHVLHTRWMTEVKSVKAYSKKLKECANYTIGRAQSQFELDHAGIVAKFKAKAGME